MYAKRQQDPTPATRYRSERICMVNGQFFFATRENTLEGPFFSRVDAQQAIDRYLELCHPRDSRAQKPH